MTKQQTDTNAISNKAADEGENTWHGLFTLEDESESDVEADSASTQKYQSLNRHCPDNKIYPRTRKLF